MNKIDATLPLGAAATWIALCKDARHPTLDNRVLCVFEGTDKTLELWVPTLRGLSIRVGDRLLLTQPANGSEPIVVGVVDGFKRRAAPTTTAGVRLSLERDEHVIVESAAGTPLMALRDSDAGPVARLLHDDVCFEVEGELKISAKAIALTAREGEAAIEAASDVVVRGETIQLN